MLSVRLSQSFACAARQSTRRSYATQPSFSSGSTLPILLGLAAIAGGGYWYYSSGGHIPSPEEVKKLENKAIGALGVQTSASLKSALDSKEFRNFKLIKVEPYNHNSATFTFELPKDHVSGLTVASAVVTRAADDSLKDDKDKPIIRPYTPTTAPNTEGKIEFIVKKYDAGKMSKHIHKLKIGDELAIKGPIKKFDWKPNEFERVAFIMGGSGITPAWQVLQEIDANSEDKTKATLIYSNVTEKDILIREKLDDLQRRKPDQFNIVYTVDKPTRTWKGPSGFVTADLLSKTLPPASADAIKVFVCGPPPQVAHISGPKDGMKQGELKGILAELGYKDSQVFKF